VLLAEEDRYGVLRRFESRDFRCTRDLKNCPGASSHLQFIERAIDIRATY